MKVLVEGYKRCSIEKVIEKDAYTIARVKEEDDQPLKESESKNLIMNGTTKARERFDRP